MKNLYVLLKLIGKNPVPREGLLVVAIQTPLLSKAHWLTFINKFKKGVQNYCYKKQKILKALMTNRLSKPKKFYQTHLLNR